jgi:hypothetical protein
VSVPYGPPEPTAEEEEAWLHANAIPLDDDCASCGDPACPEGECPDSKRPCGHHCNHIWTHDACHWCGHEEKPQ